MLVLGCEPSPTRSVKASEAPPVVAPAPAPKRTAAAPVREAPSAPETTLGVGDTGVFDDLRDRVQLPAPSGKDIRFDVDRRHGVLVAYGDGTPQKVYPLGGSARLSVGGQELTLRPGDRAELSPLAARAQLRDAEASDDADGDGIPNSLDVLIGALKAEANGAAYDDGYFNLKYPGGDPPRTHGACVDVIVRAVRNAGMDLQAAVHDDIRAAPALYGITRPDSNIDHRRVRTVIKYFKRHWEAHTPALDDPSDPLQPGDVVFLETIAARPGPDHVGVVTRTRGETGKPLVINNWTTGYTTRKMDLLSLVPVTHRFRFPRR